MAFLWAEIQGSGFPPCCSLSFTRCFKVLNCIKPSKGNKQRGSCMKSFYLPGLAMVPITSHIPLPGTQTWGHTYLPEELGNAAHLCSQEEEGTTVCCCWTISLWPHSQRIELCYLFYCISWVFNGRDWPHIYSYLKILGNVCSMRLLFLCAKEIEKGSVSELIHSILKQRAYSTAFEEQLATWVSTLRP